MDIAEWRDAELPAAIDALLEEALATDHDWVADFRPAWQAGPFLGDGEALFLVNEGGRLLAMAVVSADPFVDDGTTGRLRFIYVAVAARRRGIADALVTRCIRHAGGRWRRLRLHTDNPVAARLYERHGFRPVTGEVRATHVADLRPPV